MRLIRNLNKAFAVIVALAVPTLVQSQDRASNQAGDIQFELVGQVTNATPTTSIQRFQLGNSSFTFGKVGQTFRTTVFGHLNSPIPPSAYIAGYAAGPDLVRP